MISLEFVINTFNTGMVQFSCILKEKKGNNLVPKGEIWAKAFYVIIYVSDLVY